VRPRLLLVGRTRYRLPLDESRRRKFDALNEVLDLRVLGSAPAGAPRRDDTFRLVPPFPVRPLDGLLYHALLPFRLARELRRFRPDAVLVQGAHEAALVLAGRALARSSVPVALDVHGDWRTATRLYGSPWRRVLNPLADRLAAGAVRRVQAVRTVTDFTTELVRDAGVEPAAIFPAFMDLEPFLGPPAQLPDEPVVLFVGVLELYKGVDVLAEAWPSVAARLPGAELRIVGRGPLAHVVESLQVSWDRELATEEVAAALDAATCLVLPSRREGMGRVVVEALLRGRPVVGSDSGGIRDLVQNGENGLLVPEGDPEALANALVRLLSDRALAERLARAARPSVEQFVATPEEYAERVRALVATLN
jgi:glycosyltransferase involved in cell wall biosynthesis